MKEELLIKDPVIPKDLAIEKAGNASKLAKTLGVTRQCVSAWEGILPPLHAYRLLKVYPGIDRQ